MLQKFIETAELKDLVILKSFLDVMSNRFGSADIFDVYKRSQEYSKDLWEADNIIQIKDIVHLVDTGIFRYTKRGSRVNPKLVRIKLVPDLNDMEEIINLIDRRIEHLKSTRREKFK